MWTREVLCEAVEAAQLLRVADMATASLMLVVDADERRSLLNVELGLGLWEAAIVLTAGLMLTFLDSLFCFAGEVEEEEEEGRPLPPPLALAAVVATPDRAVDDEPDAPTAFRLEVDDRPANICNSMNHSIRSIHKPNKTETHVAQILSLAFFLHLYKLDLDRHF